MDSIANASIKMRACDPAPHFTSCVTALVVAGKLTACQRALFRLGASRVVGLPARFVFGRDARPTFDALRAALAGDG